MEIRDIEKLAKLSRLELTDTEKATFARDLENILQYVDQIREVTTDTAGAGSTDAAAMEVGDIYNVLREDVLLPDHQTGQFPERILAGVPDSQDGFIKVKKILW